MNSVAGIKINARFDVCPQIPKLLNKERRRIRIGSLLEIRLPNYFNYKGNAAIIACPREVNQRSKGSHYSLCFLSIVVVEQR